MKTFLYSLDSILMWLIKEGPLWLWSIRTLVKQTLPAWVGREVREKNNQMTAEEPSVHKAYYSLAYILSCLSLKYFQSPNPSRDLIFPPPSSHINIRPLSPLSILGFTTSIFLINFPKFRTGLNRLSN